MCHRGYSKALLTPSVLVNLSALLLRMKNWTKPRWIHPAHESIPSKDSCQPILLFFFFFHSFLLVFPLSIPGPSLWCSAAAGWGCWGREQGGPGVPLAQWVPACTGLSTLGLLALAKAPPFPHHCGLSCRAFQALPTKAASPSSALLSDSMWECSSSKIKAAD